MNHKLMKFLPGLTPQNAAMFLSELIGEPITEDELFELHATGHLPVVKRADFAGVPVHPPAPGSGDSIWPIWHDQLGVIPMMYTDTLVYPIQHVETPLGVVPVSNVDGFIYAWFKRFADDGTPAHLSQLLPPDDIESDFRPGDLIALALEASSTHTPASPPGPKTRGKAWTYTGDGRKVFDMLPVEAKEVKDATPEVGTANPAPSHLLTIAILLELQNEPKPIRRNQSGVISEILDRYEGVRGLSKRTLEDIFSAANKAKERLH